MHMCVSLIGYCAQVMLLVSLVLRSGTAPLVHLYTLRAINNLIMANRADCLHECVWAVLF